jgi:hypothetical protein
MTRHEEAKVHSLGVWAMIAIMVVVLVSLIATYDPAKDPTWHHHTADCAMHGCVLIP